MFDKFTRKIKKGAVEDVKRTIKEEAIKCADDILPQLVGIASIALIVLSAVLPQKLQTQQIIINNFYFRR